MDFIRVMRYIGMMTFCGCSAGVLFTFVFMAVLGLSGFQAVYALSLFSSLSVTGGVTAFVKLKEPSL